MISFVVKAIFPSLPMKKARDILEKKLKSFADLTFRTKFSAEEIMSLVRECTIDLVLSSSKMVLRWKVLSAACL